MTTHRVTQLGTLGLEISDLARWEELATAILGLECGDRDPDGTVFLRVDEHHHRFALRQGPRGDLAYAGWLAPDEAALRAIAGFEASDLGLGHIVLTVDDHDASLRFYQNGLGLRISD